MKKIIPLLLAFSTLLSLAACSAAEENRTENVTEEVQKTEESQKKTEETKEEEKVVYDVVDTPLTPERVAAIPIANENMSIAELRQICVDYVKLSVSFQWVPNADIDYEANQNNGTPVHFDEGKLHGGLPYINTASGNLYRTLEFYDTQTGILDVTYLSKNTKIFGTACSGTTGWGWARVINSAVTSWTHSLNASHGLIPVGPYQYDFTIEKFWESNGEGGRDRFANTVDICKNNGEQIMYQSYEKVLTADCIVNNGHVRMIAGTPEVAYNEDGTIDGENSRVLCVEQGLFTNGEYHKRVSANGTPYLIQGNDGTYFTFKTLYDTGYLPHTFKEFLGQDPVEPGAATVPHTASSISVDELNVGKFTANYPISEVFTTITDANGEVKLRYAYRVKNHYTRELDLIDLIPRAALVPYQEQGNCTVTLSAQLGNGEIVTAYTATLAG